MALSKNVIKFIQSLSQNKKREELNLFVAEGEKIVSDLLESDFNIHSLYYTDDWLEKNSHLGTLIEHYKNSLITGKELDLISGLSAPNKILAVCEIKRLSLEKHFIEKGLSVYLDSIRDPGNMGTLIRVADWFGIEQIIISGDCVDVYNPKVVQSAMGSLFRMKMLPCDDPESFFRKLKEKKRSTIYATHMNGKNIYSHSLKPNAIVILGNESSGINKFLIEAADERISIPFYNEKRNRKPDSLNVAVAGAIIISEFRRKSGYI